MTKPMGREMGFLIVGASGFLGRALWRTLQGSANSVVGTSTSGSEGLFKFDLRTDRISQVLEAVPDGPSWAVVCACISQIDRCARERELSRQVNVERTQQLLSDLHYNGIRPIFISTSYVFDGKQGGYSEDAPVSPACEYGRQKAEVEAWLHSEIPEAAILRLDKLVSAERHASNLFHQWYEQARQNAPDQGGSVIRCIAGQQFSPTSTFDIANAIWKVAELDLSGTFHVTGPDVWGRAELAEYFLGELELDAQVREVSQAEFGFDDLRPLKTSLDNRQFTERTKLRFQIMQDVVEQYRQQLRAS